jgi:hypothetical protein
VSVDVVVAVEIGLPVWRMGSKSGKTPRSCRREGVDGRNIDVAASKA